MRLFILLLLTTIPLYSNADDSGVFAGASLGRAKIDLATDFEGEPTSVYAPGFSLNVGYLFDSNLVTQVGVLSAQNFSLFGATDRYSLSHYEISIGYKINWYKLSLTPRIGYTDWELDAKEGQLFNPGGEETKHQSDNDFLWVASIGYRINRKFELSLSHRNTDTDFGDYALSSLELTKAL